MHGELQAHPAHFNVRDELRPNIQKLTNVGNTLLNGRHGCTAERLQENKAAPLRLSLCIGLFMSLLLPRGFFGRKKKVL
jgi:hypothetical protein